MLKVVVIVTMAFFLLCSSAGCSSGGSGTEADIPVLDTDSVTMDDYAADTEKAAEASVIAEGAEGISDGDEPEPDTCLCDLPDTETDINFNETDAVEDAGLDTAGNPDADAAIDSNYLKIVSHTALLRTDSPVTLFVEAGSAIASVRYLADSYELGIAQVKADKFSFTYAFTQLGPRKIVAEGRDAAGTKIAEDSIILRVKKAANSTLRSETIAAIKASSRWHKATPQDSEGRGIYPGSGEVDNRSEKIYPPFVLGPRRQTDYQVRQLYLLLPETIRKETAFVITDRIAQSPEEYLPYLQSRKDIVIIGNFVGVGTAEEDYQWFLDRHAAELAMLKQTITLAQSLGLYIHGVFMTMGDSMSTYASTVKARNEKNVNDWLTAQGLSYLKRPVSWGADESVHAAFAYMLPEAKITVDYATATCKHHYDGGKTSAEVISGKLSELGLVVDAVAPDFRVFVFTNAAGEDGTFPNSNTQRTLDTDTFAAYRTLTDTQKAKVAIIDGRMFNGAYDKFAVTDSCAWLAYGSWGTFANKVGSTLATAKILYFAQNEAARRQLLLESVAHDVYANGYRDGRDKFSPLLSAEGITFDHFNGYTTQADTTTVFEVLNDYVNDAMSTHYTANTCMKDRSIRITPQLWRTFESEVHLLPLLLGETDAVGIFRTDLPSAVFNPANNGMFHKCDLDYLVNEVE